MLHHFHLLFSSAFTPPGILSLFSFIFHVMLSSRCIFDYLSEYFGDTGKHSTIDDDIDAYYISFPVAYDMLSQYRTKFCRSAALSFASGCYIFIGISRWQKLRWFFPFWRCSHTPPPATDMLRRIISRRPARLFILMPKRKRRLHYSPFSFIIFAASLPHCCLNTPLAEDVRGLIFEFSTLKAKPARLYLHGLSRW